MLAPASVKDAEKDGQSNDHETSDRATNDCTNRSSRRLGGSNVASSPAAAIVHQARSAPGLCGGVETVDFRVAGNGGGVGNDLLVQGCCSIRSRERRRAAFDVDALEGGRRFRGNGVDHC